MFYDLLTFRDVFCLCAQLGSRFLTVHVSRWRRQQLHRFAKSAITEKCTFTYTRHTELAPALITAKRKAKTHPHTATVTVITPSLPATPLLHRVRLLKDNTIMIRSVKHVTTRGKKAALKRGINMQNNSNRRHEHAIPGSTLISIVAISIALI